jgi:hypothetical protein
MRLCGLYAAAANARFAGRSTQSIFYPALMFFSVSPDCALVVDLHIYRIGIGPGPRGGSDSACPERTQDALTQLVRPE